MSDLGTKMVRLKDIAARAGVSVMTVSKCLRNEPDISAATRARVCLLANQMGYLPDIAADGCAIVGGRLFVPAMFLRRLSGLYPFRRDDDLEAVLNPTYGPEVRFEKRKTGLFLRVVRWSQWAEVGQVLSAMKAEP